MNIINLEKKKNLRQLSKSKALEIHNHMLALAGNPEVLKDFIKDNNLDHELYKIILESETYLQNKEDDHDR